ncbi:hypothetical protein M427DRAFT_236557 [Gonapodya prolifera JEL478]|uniref:tRNA/rRNA methyltransferase SpoU type domain-containing protein n=1 Tax=Gonapodya prolifera (strain JEL478) TaxID=1344416 RepID=A0A139AMI4_GONPJ|nr:hypothetical protein M427DRAFT_236557 [Gonapodya prolifera JEL478]|eukprot:KXS17981.1 hypothetical protein M427DRAFT_236557 [Gonapodya prolifera JEL478]
MDRDYTCRVFLNSLFLMLQMQPSTSSDSAIESFIAQLQNICGTGSELESKYLGSTDQRRRSRAWSSLFMFMPWILQWSNLADFVDWLFVRLKSEILPATRHFVEWSLALVLVRCPEFRPLLWRHLKNFRGKAHITISLCTVSLFVTRKRYQEHQFLTDLCDSLTPWLTCNHFTVRAYAQWVLYTAWQLADRDVVKSTGLTAIAPLVNFLVENPECQRHREQFYLEYALSAFDVEEDLTIDYIFSGHGQLQGYTTDEIISSHAFGRVLLTAPIAIPLLNETRKTIYDLWQKKALQLPVQVDDPTSSNVVQRKGDVWSNHEVDFSIPFEKSQKVPRLPLILAASLLEKPENLGGLSRTCEIFGVETLVLHSMKVTTEAAFQSLAVTSHLHLPLLEVLRRNLPEFLTAKRREGYTIVGVEQAESSVALNHASIPERIILVLGNEKGGIPPNILTLCDMLIEIPQSGETRSLNVHVSGSLVMWEYIRQRLDTGNVREIA